MFVEIKDYDAAICCYLMSLNYGMTEMAQSELFHISENINKKIRREKYYKKLTAVFEKRDIQLGPSEDILGLAFEGGKQCEKSKDWEGAYFYYKICYDLSSDDEIKCKLEKLQGLI